MNALSSTGLVVAVASSIFIGGCDGSSLVATERISQLLDKTMTTWPAISHFADKAGSNKIGSDIDHKGAKPKFPAAAINHHQLAVSAIEALNQRRQACGFGQLHTDEALMALSERHAKYIQHVFVQADAMPKHYAPHSEQPISGFMGVTGQQNPYYTGKDLLARVQAANYQHRDNMVAESIATRLLYESAGLSELNTGQVTAEMLTALLAAPYHLATLLSPAFNENGTSLISFVPHHKDHAKARGFILVSTNGASEKLPLPDKLLTYPCDGSGNTARMLDNESPNPVQGLGRDLRADPVGQPIYITYPAAKKIQVSGIRFIDTSSQQPVATYLLDPSSDPHKNTAAQLPANSAFIIPLTDGFSNCTAKVRSVHNNCGLNPNTRYRASFTVQIDDGQTLQRSVDFTTGSHAD